MELNDQFVRVQKKKTTPKAREQFFIVFAMISFKITCRHGFQKYLALSLGQVVKFIFHELFGIPSYQFLKLYEMFCEREASHFR